MSIETILREHRRNVLPLSIDDKVRITVRRGHLWSNVLHKLRNGLDLSKHLKVTFIGEPGVDEGGPLREFLFLLISSIAQNNTLFQGGSSACVPMHNVVKLQRMTCWGMSRPINCSWWPCSPVFFPSAVASYIAYGARKLEATVDDVPDEGIREVKAFIL